MNDNKTIKVLRIITLTLTLMLLVFALAKKVGLCASDSGSFDGFYPITLPLPINNMYFGTPQSLDSTALSKITAVSSVTPNAICYWDSGTDYIDVSCFNYDSFEVSPSTGSNYTEIDFSFRFHVLGTSIVRYNFDTQTASLIQNFGSGFTTWAISYDSFSTLPDNSLYIPFYVHKVHYPIWVASGSLSWNGVIYFQNWNYHSVGGGLSEYSDEVQDFIDSQLNDVDTSAPSNSTSIPSWLQSILNGLGTLNNTIGGGFSWIRNGINNIWGSITDFSDNVTGFFENLYDSISGGVSSIVGKLDDVITSIEGNSGDYETVADAWIDCYEDSLIYDFISEFSVVDASLKSLVNTSPASSVSFSMGLPSWNVPNVSGSGSSNILANHNSISFNFDWYTVPRYANGDSIRDRIWLIFIPFILFGFMWRLLSKIPSILGGNSGLSEGVHKTIEVSSIYANKTN